MQRLADLAGSSFRTLRKYKALWHPEHRLSTSWVTPQPATVSAPECPAAETQPKSSNPREIRVLPTLKKTMKCGAITAPPPEVRIEEKKDIRGVRGEASRFPQLAGTDSAESVVHLSAYQPLPTLPPSATPEERTVHDLKEAYRQCVFKLRWSKPQRDAYIAEQFAGKRFYQLTVDEMMLLIYQLRCQSAHVLED
jgi:hypothetical protein